MVYQDLTSSQLKASRPLRIASLADRLLAFVFDLVLFIPVFSFILANLFRKLELMYFVSPNSIEFLILCGVSFAFVSFLAILFQTLFLLIMGATPGKYFFKMQVVGLQNPLGKLRFSQALLRSFLWVVEILCFFLPFLEILSDESRRPLHDRAAGTMVITLKNEGDQGPHVLETHFVRQILLAVSLGVFVWSIFLVGHFYKMAIHGEFKKSELETDSYLCSAVSASVGTGEMRLDKSLALYLADEISDDCLAAEADFVLWTLTDREKAWAYLAKGMLRKYDTSQFEAYLDKACEIDEAGEACEIAQYQADPERYALSTESQTGAVLKVIQDFEKGRYNQAETGFRKLAQEQGFESFSQQGLVKSFWAQNKLERAKGAYQNVIHQMAPSSGVELSAWICHEELDRGCSQEAVDACENLKSSAKLSADRPFISLALIRENECRQTSHVDAVQFRALLEENKDILQFVRAIARDSNLNKTERARLLQDLALRKEPVRPLFLRRMALQQWVDVAQTEGEFERIAQFLKDKKIHDLSWVKIYDKALKVFIRMRAEKSLKQIVDLPSEDLIISHDLHAAQIQAHYLVGNYERAWNEMRSQQMQRAPASVEAGDLSLQQIRLDIQKKWNSMRKER